MAKQSQKTNVNQEITSPFRFAVTVAVNKNLMSVQCLDFQGIASFSNSLL